MAQPDGAPGDAPGAPPFPGLDLRGAVVVPIGTPDAWASAVDTGATVVLVDAHVTAHDVERALAALDEGAEVVVGAAPVADTVKVVEDGFVVATVDRDGLVALRPPVVVAGGLAGRVAPPRPGALVSWVEECRGRGAVELLPLV